MCHRLLIKKKAIHLYAYINLNHGAGFTPENTSHIELFQHSVQVQGKKLNFSQRYTRLNGAWGENPVLFQRKHDPGCFKNVTLCDIVKKTAAGLMWSGFLCGCRLYDCTGL